MAKLRVDKIASVGVSTETTGSVFFDNSGDYLVPPVDDDELILGDTYSVEWWHYLSAIGTGDKRHGFVMAASAETTTLNESGGLGIYTENDGSNQFIRVRANNTGSDVSTPAGSVLAEVWQHCAVQVNENSCEIYIDGALKASGNTNGSVTQRIRRIGSVYFTNTDYDTQGYISNLRICKGHVVYTSNFTPPTRELEAHAGSVNDRTVLLCCYDGDNIFAEKTGRILRAVGDRSSSPTPTATDSPIGITTFQPGLTRDVDVTAGPVFQGGAAFTSQNWLTLPKGTTTQRGRGRGLFGSGSDPSKTNSIDYVNINSMGNAQDFGDLTEARDKIAAAGSSTRGLFAGGDPSSNTIAYVTLATTGNAVNFGDLPYDGWGTGAASNDIRWLNFGDYSTNRISYVTMSTLGDAQDFGDLLTTGPYHKGCGSSVRAIIYPPSGGSDIQFLTFASLGNAISFGDKLDSVQSGFGAASDSTRAVRFGGRDNPGGNTINTMAYVTIATTGNAQDFGDLTSTSKDGDATSNSIRGVHNIGYDSADSNAIDYVTIQTTGNAKDFGDLTTATRKQGGTTSDSHGGVG